MKGTMKLFLDCLPCVLRQVLEASRLVEADAACQTRIMDGAVTVLARREDFDNAPAMAAAMHEIVRSETGNDDPYRELKLRDMNAALGLEPSLRAFAATGDSLERALKVAATGNVMDAALYAGIDTAAGIAEELQRPFARRDSDALRADLVTAKTVLVIGDNAGEAVFDKVLLSLLNETHQVTYATRGRAVINDVTLEDARYVGVDAHARLISSGSDLPGTMLSRTTEEFAELFANADVVISKGQGNFESLSAEVRPIYFLLKAKCPMVSAELDTAVGDYVFIRRPKR